MNPNSPNNRIILVGPPGAGKGTQAILVCKALKVPHISTGEIMREAVAAKSDLGKKVAGYLDKGELVPDDLVIDVARERLLREDCANGYLLDGFPRTVEQARALKSMLEQLNTPMPYVIELKVPNEVLLERIKKRGTTGGGARTDDTEDVAKRRLKVFLEQTAPVMEFYRNLNALKQVDGVGKVDEVNKRILEVVRS